eukprot:TRINITY_DN8414_c1_g1_i1.p1 TRINITY_DN8414_c1_g1~~TRINITY_DN8414_c1_g1_i1.p1  ORF type:complete len:370 (+),score=94.79 TRINITY_DN8414_c1_g1_i1:75-1112(+)
MGAPALQERLAAALRRALQQPGGRGAVVAVAGPELSGLSGLPDFGSREGGAWVIGDTEYHPAALATQHSFNRIWWEVWAWYAWRAACALSVEPNRAHRALRGLTELMPEQFRVVSLCSDGLLRKAGLPARAVVEMRGCITTMRCAHPQRPHAEREFPLPIIPGLPPGGWRDFADPSRYRLQQEQVALLRCPLCLYKARPNELWHDEGLDTASPGVAARMRAAARDCRLLLLCGGAGADKAAEAAAGRLVAEVTAKGGEVICLGDAAVPQRAPGDPVHAEGQTGIRVTRKSFPHPIPPQPAPPAPGPAAADAAAARLGDGMLALLAAAESVSGAPPSAHHRTCTAA